MHFHYHQAVSQVSQLDLSCRVSGKNPSGLRQWITHCFIDILSRYSDKCVGVSAGLIFFRLQSISRISGIKYTLLNPDDPSNSWLLKVLLNALL